MTPDRIELQFDIRKKDRARAQHFLRNRAIMRHMGFLGYVIGAPMFCVIAAYCAVWIVPNFVGLIVQIGRAGLPAEFGVADAIRAAADLFILCFSVRVAWNGLRRNLGLVATDAGGRDGVTLGSARLTANGDGITIERSKCRSVLRWPAILGVEEHGDTLLLMLSRDSGIVVPKSAFRSRAQAHSFRDFVERRIAAAA